MAKEEYVKPTVEVKLYNKDFDLFTEDVKKEPKEEPKNKPKQYVR